MKRLTQLQRLLCGVACAAALSACTATAPVKPTEPPAPVPLDQVMTQAAQASEAGQKEQALTLLQQAAKNYPTEKAPYLQMAQIKFDGGQYGDAILDSQQALARDPTDTKANSLVAISGLRLATTALADLTRQNNLSGTVRSESLGLAKLLRESIGETDLLQTKKSTVRTARKVQTVKPAQAAEDDSANPFGSLK
jgi:tetratricopeptide (TPR) repeat protein